MQTADVEELESGPPEEIAVENAYRKAAAVAEGTDAALVLGVDTVVAVGMRIYGKPREAAEAAETLRALSARRHAVISGICLIQNGSARTAAARTLVEFRALDEPLIEWYVRTGEWRERAGGYAIQGQGAALIAAVEGDYSNVVGLPIPTLLELEPGLLVPPGPPP